MLWGAGNNDTRGLQSSPVSSDHEHPENGPWLWCARCNAFAEQIFQAVPTACSMLRIGARCHGEVERVAVPNLTWPKYGAILHIGRTHGPTVNVRIIAALHPIIVHLGEVFTGEEGPRWRLDC